jgi:arginyl-tRNA synthetase
LDSLTLKEISDAYVFGSFEYKNNQEVREEANKINIEIYNFLENDNSRESENTKFYERGKALSMDHFEEITKKLGSFFSEKIFESETERVGREIVKKNIPNVFKDSEGAVIFEGKNFTNVFINSDNFGTYLAKDIGLLKVKSQKFSDVKHSLVVTDIEQKQHFEMLKEAGAKISDISDFTEKSKYLQHGRMSFAGSEKISSRFGNVPLATELIDMVKKKILEKMKDRDFTNEEKEGISQKLAIANLKYSILKVTSGKNISFDMEKDLNPQGNTATFLLYSFVRARSILSKADLSIDSLRERKEDISSLEKRMYRFSEEVEKSLKDYSPHHLANFLYDLAKEFNSFYTNTKILDEKNSDYFYNLKILNKFSQTMKKGLELLGIETVEKM